MFWYCFVSHAAPTTQPTTQPTTAPTYTIGGGCPVVQGGFGICPVTCTANSNCTGEQLCCLSSCGGRTCASPCPNVTCATQCSKYTADKNGCPTCACAGKFSLFWFGHWRVPLCNSLLHFVSWWISNRTKPPPLFAAHSTPPPTGKLSCISLYYNISDGYEKLNRYGLTDDANADGRWSNLMHSLTCWPQPRCWKIISFVLRCIL